MGYTQPPVILNKTKHNTPYPFTVTDPDMYTTDPFTVTDQDLYLNSSLTVTDQDNTNTSLTSTALG